MARNPILWTLGAVFLVCGAGGVLVGTKLYSGYNSASDESTAFADKELPLILKHWDSQELYSKGTPELRAAATATSLDSLFGYYRKHLGELEGVEPSSMETVFASSLNRRSKVTAKVVARASFHRDNAVVKMFLVKEDSTWKINAFSINAPIFKKEPPRFTVQ